MNSKNLNSIEALIKRGSKTAKNGFKNEADIVKKFNNWNKDSDAKDWLGLMGYKIEEIESVTAVKVKGSYKTDVQVEITILLKSAKGIENISVKLVSNKSGFNQIDKRKIETYENLWLFPENITLILKMFTGAVVPVKPSKKDIRRIFLNELSSKDQQLVIGYFEANKIMIIADLFRGRDAMLASWMLIYQKDTNIWTLLPISTVMNYYGNGPVRITSQGSLKIGKVGMQRKGGDNGRESAKMLQFKFDPCDIVKNQNELES